MTEDTSEDRMQKIVSLCKRRGFVFQSSEIYGGLKSSYDYGPLGVELKRNVKDAWWRSMVHSREDIVGIDAAIIMHPKVWEASGHLATFTDPLVDCPNCKSYRIDARLAKELEKLLFGESDYDLLRFLRCATHQANAEEPVCLTPSNWRAVAKRHRETPVQEKLDKLLRLCATFTGGVGEVSLLDFYWDSFSVDTPHKEHTYIPLTGDSGMETLIEALEDENRNVRLSASSALGYIGPAAKEAVPALINALKYGDPSVRSNAASALIRIDPESYYEARAVEPGAE